MDTSELLRLRLYNQLLSDHQLEEPQEVVSWMGAMQAQALDLAKWGIGVRLRGKTVGDVEQAMNIGKIIRTHILRPTWHFVAAEDIHWMADLSNERLKPVFLSYCKMTGADESLVFRAVSLLEKLMEGGLHLTKQEMSDLLLSKDITADGSLLNIIIYMAEMEGVLCNGRVQGSRQTFTLLGEWAPRRGAICREEALGCLARKYFTSHGPATVHDFTWWSGLTLTECRQAIEMIKGDFVCIKVNGRDFWMKNDIETPPADARSVLLLPPFDEFVVSYKDRSEIIESTHYGKVMTKNGLFSPTVMLDGEIVGSWKKTVKKGKAQAELSFFEKTPKKTQALFDPEIERLGEFY